PSAPKISSRTSAKFGLSLHCRLARYNKCAYNIRMIMQLKLRRVGNSVGLVLPREALARLNAAEGDAVYLTETTDGGFRLTANNPGFADKMKVVERLSRRYR